jgi:hypothetical protein
MIISVCGADIKFSVVRDRAFLICDCEAAAETKRHMNRYPETKRHTKRHIHVTPKRSVT